MKTLHALIAIALLNTIMILGVVSLANRSPQQTTILPAPSTIPVQSVLPTSTPRTQPRGTSQPVANPTLIPTPTFAPPPSNRCIVTIDGVRYDLTDFRFIHSGGDIFNCGTDMSAIFWGQHGQSMLNRLQRYRI